MKNQRQINQLLANASFVQWVKSPTPQRDLYWSNWLKQHPDQAKAFHTARTIILGIKLKSVNQQPINSEEKDALLEKILVASPSLKVTPSTQTRTRKAISSYLRVAAILCVAIGAGLIIHLNTPSTAKVELPVVSTVTKENPKGQRIKFQLPDGSIVWLNADSRLDFPEQFSAQVRMVHLRGEAFFEVKHDEARPFDVVINDKSVRVLGTSFNVRSFPDDDHTLAVSLVSGKVSVRRDADQEHTLSPGEQVVYHRHEAIVQVFDPEEVIAWKKGILRFRDSSLSQVKAILERWYGINVTVVGSPSRRWRINGEFANQSAERVLERLAFAENFTFSIEGKQVTITF
ncbi:FecR family protein [Tunicatimonas pelagia]|uniref:FecR family protein n=1 Tax=Tunicatimonas pelagia TaxID=931531 RepID=UPI002665CD03|nr:FecR domain-containing protein [Tunicatimonas pelagia]WKN45702.1 FecR domain-containing protein [Tunicatimonas pelagia]